jgi:hypothetical protein
MSHHCLHHWCWPLSCMCRVNTSRQRAYDLCESDSIPISMFLPLKHHGYCFIFARWWCWAPLSCRCVYKVVVIPETMQQNYTKHCSGYISLEYMCKGFILSIYWWMMVKLNVDPYKTCGQVTFCRLNFSFFQ